MRSRLTNAVIRILVIVSLIHEAIAVKQRLKTAKKDTTAAVYVGITIALIFFAFCILYCCKKCCPGGPTFSSLDLDEIRLERFDDIERQLKQEMRSIQAKLDFHRERKNQQNSHLSKEEEEERRLLENEGIEFESPLRKLEKTSAQQRRREEPLLLQSLNNSKESARRTPQKEDKSSDGEDKDMWGQWSKHSTGEPVKRKDKSKGDTLDSSAHSERSYAYHSFRFENKHPSRTSSAALLPVPSATPQKANDIMITSPAPPVKPLPARPRPPPPQGKPPNARSPIQQPQVVKMSSEGTRSAPNGNYSIDVAAQNYRIDDSTGLRELNKRRE